MARFYTCILIALLLSITAIADPQGTYETASITEGYAMWRAGTFCLDVRTTAEVAEGQIPGALNIDVNILAANLGDLSGLEHLDILVYCKAGSRGAQASQILADNSFTSVYNLEGGFDAWKANCYETAIPLSILAPIGLPEALDEFNATEPTAIFLDTRSDKAYDTGHIPGTWHIPLDELANNLDILSGYEDTDIIVYHSNCSKSDDAAALLVANGFNQVYEMPKGYEGWVALGYITEPEGGALPASCGPESSPATRTGDLLLLFLLGVILLWPAGIRKSLCKD